MKRREIEIKHGIVPELNMKTLIKNKSTDKKLSYRTDFLLLFAFALMIALFYACQYACFWRYGVYLYYDRIASEVLLYSSMLYFPCIVVLFILQIRRAISLGKICGWRRLCVQISFVPLVIAIFVVLSFFNPNPHVPVTNGLAITLKKKADIPAIQAWLESPAATEYILKYGELSLCELIVSQNDIMLSPQNIRKYAPEIYRVIEHADLEEIRKWLGDAAEGQHKGFYGKLEECYWPDAISELSPGVVSLDTKYEMHGEVTLSWGGNVDEAKWPDAIRCLNPMRVYSGRTPEGKPYARLMWGGRDVGPFGIVVGANHDQIEYDDNYRSEYRVQFGSEAFLWHSRQQ